MYLRVSGCVNVNWLRMETTERISKHADEHLGAIKWGKMEILTRRSYL
jgi:hypothetical protein